MAVNLALHLQRNIGAYIAPQILSLPWMIPGRSCAEKAVHVFACQRAQVWWRPVLVAPPNRTRERLNGWTNNSHDNGSKPGITMTKKYWGLHCTCWAPHILSLPWMMPGRLCGVGLRESYARWRVSGLSACAGLVTTSAYPIAEITNY